MTISCDFDADPSKYIDAGQAKVLLKMRSLDLVTEILSNRFLRNELNTILRAQLEPIPQHISRRSAVLFNNIAVAPSKFLHDLSRRMAILINHQAILGVTDGKILKEIVKWDGRKDVIRIIHRSRLPIFERFAVLSNATSETLDLYASEIRRYILGLLPSSYAQRLRLRFPEDGAPPFAFFDIDDPDRETFLDCAMNSHLLPSQEKLIHA